MRRITRALPFITTIVLLATASSCKKDKDQPTPEPAEDTAAATDQPAAEDAAAAQPTGQEDQGAPSPEVIEQAKGAIATLERIGEVAESHKGNCDKAASALEKLVAEERTAIEGGKKLTEDPASAAYFRFKYQDRISTAQGRILQLMQACEDHAGLAEVFAAIDGE